MTSDTSQSEVLTTPPSGNAIDHVVLLLHGIRDFGGWQERAASLIEASIPGTKCVAVRYGWFGPFGFLSPWSQARSPIAKLKDAYDRARSTYWGARISIIAHSFGTHVTGECLRRHDSLRLHRLVLCGGVLRRDFDWNQVIGRIQADDGANQPCVLNECGDSDTWPVVAEIFVKRYGASGAFGFTDTVGITTRYFKGGHSLFFDDPHIRTSWIPFISGGTVPQSEVPVREPSPAFRLFLSYPPIRWLLRSFTVFVWLFLLAVPTYAIARGTWAFIPASWKDQCRQLAAIEPVVILKSEGPYWLVNGYTPRTADNPLLTNPIAAINPVLHELPDPLVGPGPVSLNTLIQKQWLSKSYAITSYCLDVVRYEAMPEFVQALEYGAGPVDLVTVRFTLEKLNTPLPWKLQVTSAHFEGSRDAEITHKRPLAVTNDQPLQVDYVITAKDPGIYWVKPSITVTQADGTDRTILLRSSEIPLAFYDAPESPWVDADPDDPTFVARMLDEVDRELECISSSEWVRVPAWEPGQKASRSEYLHERRDRLAARLPARTILPRVRRVPQ